MSVRILRTRAATLAFSCALALPSCSPKLDTPRESTRLSGVVIDAPAPTTEIKSTEAKNASGDGAEPRGTPAASDKPARGPTPISGTKPLQKFAVLNHLPVGVAIYEACTPLLYFMKRCPGRFLGEAKIKGPGPFVVEVDTQAPEIIVFGFRGFLGPEQQQEACAEVHISIADAGKPITLQLEPGTCSIKLERRYG